MDKQQGFEKAESRVEEAWREYLGEPPVLDNLVTAIIHPVVIELAHQAFFDAWELAGKEPCCYGMAAVGNQHSADCPGAAAEELKRCEDLLMLHLGPDSASEAILKLQSEHSAALARIKALEGGIAAENNRVVAEHNALRAKITELEDQLCDFRGVVED